MTVFGTRPEIIRLSCTIKKLDKFSQHVLVHTGQNYDEKLSDIFFRELDLRPPDEYLGVAAESFWDQAGQILSRTGDAIERHRPDRILILGDTNSGLVSFVAARRRIPVFHMEAGNRCFDNRVPEETNRRVIDHTSDVLMPYTHRSKENLLREGIERQRIFVIGNPIYEVLWAFRDQIDGAKVLENLGIEPKRYFLVTMHRAENVDDPQRLRNIAKALDRLALDYEQPIIVSVHPRTASKLSQLGHSFDPKVRLEAPFGFFDFVALEKNACCVITDSGTVQEECCIFKVPNVTIRETTERAETIECGSNFLTGLDPESIVRGVELAYRSPTEWSAPPEYLEPASSDIAIRIILGYMSSCDC